MTVVDASALIELLLQRSKAGAVAEILFASGNQLSAPELIDVEVLHVLRRYLLTKQLSESRANEALEDFYDLRLDRYSHANLRTRMWELRYNFTAYDAAYVVLAESLDAPLVTCDRKLGLSANAYAQTIIF